jgi:hypothetical protein
VSRCGGLSNYENQLIQNWASGVAVYRDPHSTISDTPEILRSTYGGDGATRKNLISKLRRTSFADHQLTGYISYDIAKLLLMVEAKRDVRDSVEALKRKLNGYDDFQLKKLLFTQKLLPDDYQYIKVRRYFRNGSPRYVPSFSVHKQGLKVATNNPAITQGFAHNFLKLDNALVSGIGLTFAKGELWIGDPAGDPSEDFVSGWWDKFVGHPSNSKEVATTFLPQGTPRLHLSMAVNGVFRNSANYWHQIIEYIPAIARTVIQSGCKTILWPTVAPTTALEALLSIMPDLDIKLVDPNEVIEVGSLFVCSLATATWDSTLRRPTDSCGYSAIPISKLYSQIPKLDTMREKEFRNKKILLIRESKKRTVLGLDLFRKEAKDCGFKEINPSKLNFLEQRELFQNASIIASFGGAEWANLAVANPELRAINFVSESMSWFLGHRNIAESLRIKMETVVLRNEQVEHNSFMDSIQTPLSAGVGDFSSGFDLIRKQ